jgi:hypothetical protein
LGDSFQMLLGGDFAPIKSPLFLAAIASPTASNHPTSSFPGIDRRWPLSLLNFLLSFLVLVGAEQF